MIDLARRAVAAKGWRWLPGMLDTKGLRVLRIDADGYVWAWIPKYQSEWKLSPLALPDFTDPATLGCVLALVHRAAGKQRGASYVTDVEALVVALEAVP